MKRKIVFNLFLMILLFFLKILILDKFVLKKITNSENLIKVPDLIGQEIENCIKILENKKLKYNFTKSSFFNKNIKKDIIINQNPNKNSLVKKNRTIYLTYNFFNEEFINFPTLKNLSIRNALIVLKNLDIEIDKIIYIKDIAKNIVLKCIDENSKEINENEKISKKSKIDIFVGYDNIDELIVTPKIEGIFEKEQIRFFLIENNLELGEIEYLESNIHKKGEIVDQDPKEKDLTQIGTKINLKIAK
jgi:beta-lactam-binding protein with PASTA domain